MVDAPATSYPASMARHWFRTTLYAALLCATPPQAWANDKPLLTASTENLSPGETLPFPELVRIAIRGIDPEELKICLADAGLKPNQYASLLRAVQIRSSTARNLWFVRPTIPLFCPVFYGAHAFRYFLIEEEVFKLRSRYRLLFEHSGDFFAIYPQQNHGLNDIEATGCIATECRSARLSFNGQKYRPSTCTRTTFNSRHQETRKPRRCSSDGWPDDQSSGLNPQTRP